MPRLFLGLLFAVVTVCLPARAEHTPPNIVILFADDLGINDLGCYGRKDQRTPNLDRLAAEGVRFTQAYAAASVCSASRAALLTGQSPARLRITTFLPGRSDRASHRLLSAPVNLALPAGVPTIAEVLKTKGYATMAVGKWHVGGKGHQPTDHGFDEFVPSRPNPGAESPLGGKGELGQAEAAVKFIERSKAKPFLLYLAFDNPHIPLAAPAQGIAANAKAFHPTYAALVESLDAAVGRVLKALDDQGLATLRPGPGGPPRRPGFPGPGHVALRQPADHAGPARSHLASATLHEPGWSTRRRHPRGRLETHRAVRGRQP